MNIIYLIRGLPGSGKSTLANELQAYICEADQYFMTNNVYEFSIERVAEAHRACQNKVDKAMQHGLGKIAVANTFTRRWEMTPYYDLAKKYGYKVIEITLGGEGFENTHKVPAETIQKMKERWEY